MNKLSVYKMLLQILHLKSLKIYVNIIQNLKLHQKTRINNYMISCNKNSIYHTERLLKPFKGTIKKLLKHSLFYRLTISPNHIMYFQLKLNLCLIKCMS